MPDPDLIAAACEQIVEDYLLAPEKDEDGEVVATYCNRAVQRVCNAAGYHALDGKTANEMCEFLANSAEVRIVTPEEAQKLARGGALVIAGHVYGGLETKNGRKVKKHGHVAVVYPFGGLVYSGKWKVECPTVANVGKKQELCGANFAFPVADTPPVYFVVQTV